MDREQAQELFSAYREGELPGEDVEDFEGFLEDDDEARQDYDQFCRALDTLSSLSEQPAPDDFMEKLQKKMRRRSGGKLFGASRWGQVSRVPYELFSLVLILIILTVYLLTLPVLQVAAGSSSARQDESPTGQEER
jgi:hypothetical protein